MIASKKYFCFLLFCFLQMGAWCQNAELRLLKAINKNETAFKNTYADIHSYSTIPIGIAVPVSIAALGFIKKDAAFKQDAMYMGAAFLVSGLSTKATKIIVNRKRPFETHAFITKRVWQKAGHSFPSGHSSTAFCTATSLSLRYRKWYVIVPAYLYAAGVGWARMYQGVHYPGDVLAGAIIGAGSAWAAWKIQQAHSNRKKQNSSAIF